VGGRAGQRARTSRTVQFHGMQGKATSFRVADLDWGQACRMGITINININTAR
jgi:hypothetical protein